MPLILAVDHEPRMRRALERGLAGLGHEVLTVATGTEALAFAACHEPDVVIVDMLLPDVHGTAVTKRLRVWSDVPIVGTSKVNAVDHRVAALDAGADDFLVKPFTLAELHARVNAMLRRVESGPRSAMIATDDLTIDLASRSIRRDDAALTLTPIQWQLIEALIGSRGEVATYRHLIDAVWGPDHGEEIRPSLRVHVRHLRRKLGDVTAQPRYIATVPRRGYRWAGPQPG